MPLEGSSAALDAFVRAAQDLASGSGRQAVEKNIAAELRALVDLGFHDSVAPDGTPWARLKLREGKPLDNTGAMRGSVSTGASISAGTATINIGFRFATVHQEGREISAKNARALRIPYGGSRAGGKAGRGTSVLFARKVKIPARPMIPTGALPTAWSTSLAEAVEETLAMLMQTNAAAQ